MKLSLIISTLIISTWQSETSFQFSTYWWKNSSELNEKQKSILMYIKIKN
jgi:hypothetical protein